MGSTGSRVRLIFNYMGSQYLLLLDWDDGDSKRQERIGDGIPESLVSRRRAAQKFMQKFGALLSGAEGEKILEQLNVIAKHINGVNAELGTKG